MADYSINAVTRRVVYTGSAGTGPYAFSFEILANTDVAVYKNSTKLTLTTDYTVTINANGTGSITLVSAATGSDRITIIGARAISRTTDFVTAGDLLAVSLNEQLDANIIMTQQLAEENRRTLKAPPYDPASTEDGGTLNMTLPVAATRASKVLAFDSSGNPTAGPTATEVANAQTYATNAAASASAAAASASSAASSASSASSSASAASTSASNASTSASAASSSASAASTSASNAATSASNASTSATNAGTSETNASASAALANDWATKTSGTVAGGEYSAKYHAQAAATSASSAASAQSAAESARDATLAAYDSFDDRYLGAKASDPATDNDGNALVGGALYFNTTDGVMKLYNGTAWVAAYVSGAGFVAKVGGSTGAADVPTGTTAQRPSASTGYFRFNTTLGKFEGYNGTAWGSVGGGATGGGSDDIFVENGQTVTVDYTLTAGKNAMSAGPISINSGITVTVPSGAVWTIV